MAFSKKHWLYAAVFVILLCVSLGAFLVWRASQPVGTKTVYLLPEPNPKRAELLKRAFQPQRRTYSTRLSHEATEETTTDESLETAGAELSSQGTESADTDLESALLKLREETAGENSYFPPVPEGYPLDLPPVWLDVLGYQKGDMPRHEAIDRVLIKLWNQDIRGFKSGAFRRNDGKVYPLYPDVLYIGWDEAVVNDEVGRPISVRYIASSLGTHAREFDLEDFISGEWKNKYPDTKFVAYEDAGYDPDTFLNEDD